MRRSLVAGNWKLNGSIANNQRLLDSIIAGLPPIARVDIAVCPPFIYLPGAQERLKGSMIMLGAQDVSDQDAGAFTGEVSAPMLKEFGVRFCIVGHSERRHVYGESDELTARKFAAAQRAELIPILCVGEKLEEREQGITERVIARQIDAVLELGGAAAFEGAIIAYEPVWAIGTGKSATPRQAQAVHAFIRKYLAAHNMDIADRLRILYGGSVKVSNAAELFSQTEIDGGLIGGASLNADEFLAICDAV